MHHDKGTPVARRARKARGLTETARLPKSANAHPLSSRPLCRNGSHSPQYRLPGNFERQSIRRSVLNRQQSGKLAATSQVTLQARTRHLLLRAARRACASHNRARCAKSRTRLARLDAQRTLVGRTATARHRPHHKATSPAPGSFSASTSSPPSSGSSSNPSGGSSSSDGPGPTSGPGSIGGPGSASGSGGSGLSHLLPAKPAPSPNRSHPPPRSRPGSTRART